MPTQIPSPRTIRATPETMATTSVRRTPGLTASVCDNARDMVNLRWTTHGGWRPAARKCLRPSCFGLGKSLALPDRPRAGQDRSKSRVVSQAVEVREIGQEQKLRRIDAQGLLERGKGRVGLAGIRVQHREVHWTRDIHHALLRDQRRAGAGKGFETVCVERRLQLRD